MTSRPAMVMLVGDGRFPSGGHAHSGGYEAASGLLGADDLDGLRRYLDGRLATVGRTEAALVAGARHRLDTDALDWRELDDEVQARLASPAIRSTSRALGRQWLRAGRSIWPSPDLDDLAHALDGNPHQVAAFAAVSAAAELTMSEAVTVHLHHLVSGVATAAVRLHGHDPYAVYRLQAGLAPEMERIAADTVAGARRPWRDLPAPTGIVTDLLAEDHARWDLRMFQS